MKTINEYKFTNNKSFRTSYVSRKERKKIGIHKDDNICFDWYKGEGYDKGLYLRPDEALIIAKQLIDAVWKVTGAYADGFLRDYNGYKEEKL
jgi:hypothetical protein